jgi:PAS domain S-box-containing protein
MAKQHKTKKAKTTPQKKKAIGGSQKKKPSATVIKNKYAKKKTDNLGITDESFSDIFNSSNILFVLLDKDYRYIIVNDEWCRSNGKERKDVIGKKVSVVFGRKEYNREIKPVLDEALKGKTVNHIHFYNNRYYDRYLRPYRKGKKICGVVVISVDVTDQKKTEEILRVNEQRNRTLINAMPDMMFRLNRKGVFLDFKANSSSELYLPPEMFLGKNFRELFPPELVNLCSSSIDKVFETKQLQTIEYQLDIQGKISFFEARIDLIPETDETIFIVRDITKRKHAEEALKEMNEIFRLFMKHNPFYVYIKDENLKPLYLSDNFVNLVPLPIEQMIGKSMDELFPSEFSKKIVEDDKRILADGKPIEIIEDFDGRTYSTLKFPITISNVPKYLAGYTIDITERIKAERELQDGRKQLRTLIETMPDLVVLKNPDGVYLLCNPEYEKFYGKTEAELIGKTDYDFVDKDRADKYKKIDDDALKSNKLVFSIEEIVYANDGHKAVVELIKTRLVGSKGETIGVLTVGRDITERKDTELKIENERKRLHTLIETIPDPMWVKDPDGVYLVCNPAYEKLFGMKKNEILGKTDYEIVPQETADAFKINDTKALQENKTITCFEEITFPDERQKAFFESTKTPMYDAEGKLIGTLGIARNVTKLIEANKALKDSEAKLKEAQRIAKIGHWELNLINNVLTWSDQIYNIFELDPQRFPSSYKAFIKAIHPDDREKVNKAYTEAVANKTEYEIDHRLLMKNGRVKYVNEKCYTEYSELGLPLRSIGTIQDITEHKLIEAALQESELRYRLLFEQNPAPILIYERGSLKIMAVNEAFEKHYGYSQDEYLAMRLTDLYPQEEKGKIAKLILSLHGYRDIGEWHHIRKDGSVITIISRSNDLVYKNCIARVAVISDITDRKIAEEQIKNINLELEKRVSERTEQLAIANKDLESFAYSVSHDLRAPLRHIDGFTRLLRNSLVNESQEINRYFTKITESSTKMSSMIDALLAFSRLGRRSLQKSEINLNQLVNKVIRNYEPDLLNRNIEWHIGELPVICGDYNLIQLVLDNLISNAIKFTSKKEKAIIEIDNYTEPGSKHGFYVKDNGAGFDMVYKDKLFGVFQRLHTQEEYEGTGIGLANIKQIIQKHGGTIRAEGQVDKGATFYITFYGE